MDEVIVTTKIMNLLIMATLAAFVASGTFWLLMRLIGGKRIYEKIKKLEDEPMALSIYLSVSKFTVFTLYATIFTRF